MTRLQRRGAVLAVDPMPDLVRFHAGGQADDVDRPERWRWSRKRNPCQSFPLALSMAKHDLDAGHIIRLIQRANAPGRAEIRVGPRVVARCL